MIFLVMGPERKDIVGHATSHEEARDIARELNGMLDETDYDGDDHYSVREVKAAQDHVKACREIGFPF